MAAQITLYGSKVLRPVVSEWALADTAFHPGVTL